MHLDSADYQRLMFFKRLIIYICELSNIYVMKKLLLFSLISFAGQALSQTFSPIATTGYNLDAIAEDTAALSTTGGAVDALDHIMYSYAYGQLYNSSCTGLPNNGLLANGTGTYQLQPYTQNNTLLVTQGQTNFLTLTTPASYINVSLLCFTSGLDIYMNVTLTFTDNTTQYFSALPILGWYSGGTSTVVTNFDRATRTSGTPDYATGDPNMYHIDFDLTCNNRAKQLKNITINNPSNKAEICVMALSGNNAVSYSTATTPVTCAGGNNGSATVTVNDGAPPFTYNWSLTPPVNTGSINSVSLLPVGVTNFTVTDASNCVYYSSLTVGQATVVQPPLVINASTNPICTTNTLVLSTSGAATYTWSNGNSTSSTTVAPTVQSNTFNVVATTSANCTLKGSYTVTVNSLPVITFTSIPTRLCLNANAQPLSASPAGGTFNGAGIAFGAFNPGVAGVGTQSLSYSYTDANGCTSVDTVYTTVSSPTTVVAFTVTPSSICEYAPSVTLSATPTGGTFSGQGVSGGAFAPSVAGIGTSTLSYSYTDANNCTAAESSAISVTACASPTGIEPYSTGSCQLYPNPNNGSFTIKVTMDLQVTLVNQLGQLLQTVTLDKYNSHEVFVENLPEGIYFLKAQNQVLNQKISVGQH